MVLRYLPKFSSTSLETLLVEDSMFHVEKKGRKSSIFIYGTTFRKMEFIPSFSASPNLFYLSQKTKKNYGRHPVGAAVICFFTFYYLFWRRRVVPNSRFSESRFLQGRLFDFSSRSGLAGQPVQIWTKSCFVQIFYVFPCIVEN